MAGSSPTQVAEDDVRLPDGRALHVYDRAGPNGRRAVVWHHGTPNVGLPPEPLFPIADRLGIRFVSYDRPGYGGSDPDPGRSVGSAAADVRVIVDALGIERFGTIGHSGGGPHALACAALLPERVTGAVSVAGLAPFGAEALDWFAGMAPAGAAALAAAAEGRDAKMRFEASAGSDEPGFTGSDWAALEGEWSWFGQVVVRALADGKGGLIDDDMAFVAPWGFDPADIVVPILLLHGASDRVAPSAHSRWLAERCGSAELRQVPDEGHISVLLSAPQALEWLSDKTP